MGNRSSQFPNECDRFLIGGSHHWLVSVRFANRTNNGMHWSILKFRENGWASRSIRPIAHMDIGWSTIANDVPRFAQIHLIALMY
jgi:hypothetical protein